MKASLFNRIFAGVTFIVFGLAVARSDAYPRRLRWVVLVAGVGALAAGLIQVLTGEPTQASRALTILGPRSSRCGCWSSRSCWSAWA